MSTGYATDQGVLAPAVGGPDEGASGGRPVATSRFRTALPWIAAAVTLALGFAAGGVRPLSALNQAKQEVAALRAETTTIEVTLASTQGELETVTDRYTELQETFDARVTEITRETESLRARLDRKSDALDERGRVLSDRAAQLRRQESDIAARERRLNIIERSSFGNGTWRVGSDITPGVYRAAGGNNCYWAILNSSNTYDIASNGVMVDYPTVTLTAGKWFQVDGCGEWRKIG